MNAKLSSGEFSRLVLIAAIVVGLVYLGWKLVDVILLGFGEVVFAVVLHALASVFIHRLK